MANNKGRTNSALPTDGPRAVPFHRGVAAEPRLSVLRRVRGWLRSLVSAVLIASVRVYQICLRPLLPAACRFTPSCSEYFILSVQKHGPWRGAWKGLGRIGRCHPWHPGGYDPP
jgi:putative membrane protein insertion efficiency factor